MLRLLIALERLGEKIQTWTDVTPPERVILRWLTVYWLTETFARGIHPYRHQGGRLDNYKRGRWADGAGYIEKPLGMSSFPKELMPSPKSWVEKTGELVFWKEHQEGKAHKRMDLREVVLIDTTLRLSGGHFAAIEQPGRLAEDFLAYLDAAEGKKTSSKANL